VRAAYCHPLQSAPGAGPGGLPAAIHELDAARQQLGRFCISPPSGSHHPAAHLQPRRYSEARSPISSGSRSSSLAMQLSRRRRDSLPSSRRQAAQPVPAHVQVVQSAQQPDLRRQRGERVARQVQARERPERRQVPAGQPCDAKAGQHELRELSHGAPGELRGDLRQEVRQRSVCALPAEAQPGTASGKEASAFPRVALHGQGCRGQQRCGHARKCNSGRCSMLLLDHAV